MFDFDTPPSRAGTQAEKYMARERLFGRHDVMPFWVADMEFAVAPAIQDALSARVQHPIYGYTAIAETLLEAITAWSNKRYNLSFAAEEVSLIPGVMSGMSAAVYALSEPGDAVIVQPPLYPPIMRTVLNIGRRLVENPLVIEDGRYSINFNELDHLCRNLQPKILILCSPHNPVGRVWNRVELSRLVELTNRYNVYLVSDEIHADIIFAPHQHTAALSLAEGADSRIIMLNSASKSFNVAGLNTAYAVIPNSKLRLIFRQQLRRMNLHGANLFGMTALESAYSKGEEWLNELLSYLQSNRQFMADRLTIGLPGLNHFLPEGTYLYWLDFNSLGLTPERIKEKLINEARLGLNDGMTFSRNNEGFWRFNFAVPRSMLEEGINRIIEVFS
ncbi:MAG: MalY/PatB family protein [Desulfobulbales bacterium]